MSRHRPAVSIPVFAFCCGLAAADVEGDIPFGFEATTGIRSGYVWRGIDLASSLLDFQAQAEITVAREFFINAGGWVASELDDDFAELAGFLGLRHDLSDFLTIGGEFTYRDFDDSPLEDGFDLGAYVTMHPATDWTVTVGAYRDFAAEGWYAHAQAGWSMRLSDDAFVELLGGVSWADSYYDRSGLNDFHGRASLTYNASGAVSVTPFLGWSVEIEDADGDELFGGLWFSVVF